MRLHTMNEGGFQSFYDMMAPLMAAMPKRKQEHSKRVAKRLHKAGASPTAIYAGLTHDYLERGGDLQTLNKHVKKNKLPERVVHIVQALTSDEKELPDPDTSTRNPPLEHLVAAIKSLSGKRKTKNHVLLTKMSDRYDNILRRLKRDGRLHPVYRKKAQDIIDFCRQNYDGNPEPFDAIMSKLRKVL